MKKNFLENLSLYDSATKAADALPHSISACQTHATFSTQYVDVYVPQAPSAKQVDLARMP